LYESALTAAEKLPELLYSPRRSAKTIRDREASPSSQSVSSKIPLKPSEVIANGVSSNQRKPTLTDKHSLLLPSSAERQPG